PEWAGVNPTTVRGPAIDCGEVGAPIEHILHTPLPRAMTYASVTGRLVDEESAEPLVGFEVRLRAGSNTQGFARTGEDGTFTVVDLELGEAVIDPDAPPHEADVSISAGGTATTHHARSFSVRLAAGSHT